MKRPTTSYSNFPGGCAAFAATTLFATVCLAQAPAIGADYAFLERPLSLMQGQAEGILAFSRARVGEDSRLVLLGDSNGDDSVALLQAGASVGLTDHVEFAVLGGIYVDEEETFTDLLDVGLHVDMGAPEGVQAGFQLGAQINTGKGDPLPLLRMGSPFRIRIGDMFAAHVGEDLLTIVTGDIGLLFLELNAGVSAQPTPDLAFRLDANFIQWQPGADKDTNPGVDKFKYLGDSSRVSFTAIYNVLQMFDVVGGISFPDLNDNSDAYTVGLALLART